MVKRGFHPQGPKSYQPSEQIQNFIDEKLQLLEDKQSDRNWDAQKSKILDKMFQSWTDFIYLLESIAHNPGLQDVFHDDLKDLFEVKPEDGTKQLVPIFATEVGGLRIPETAFARFVYACVIPHEGEPENFRLRLLHSLQSIVYAKMWMMLTRSIRPLDIVSQSALEDTLKALAWTKHVSQGIIDYTEDPNRFIDFPAPKYRPFFRKNKKLKI